MLASRNGGDEPAIAPLRAEMEELGADVTIAACDVADPDSLRNLIAAIPATRPLTTVVHAAGILHDATTENLTAKHLASVLHPKAAGAWNLHEITTSLPPVELIFFSSTTGVLGNPGQGNYGAANAYLDALAAHRHASGLPTTSIAWGLWEHPAGMARTLSQADLDRMARTGILPLPAQQALTLFDAIRSSGLPNAIAIQLNDNALRTLDSPSMAPRTIDSPSTVPRPLRGLASASRRPRPAPGRARSRRTARLNGPGASPPCPPASSLKFSPTWCESRRQRYWGTASRPS